MHTNILFDKTEGKRPREHLGLDRRMLLEWILYCGKGMNGIHVAQNSDQWRVLVNTVMNFEFDERRSIS
jgi:hypothetical protein